MTKQGIDFEQVRKNWLKNVDTESRIWLIHIDKRADEIRDIYSANRFPVHEPPELLFNIFAYLNWLAHVDMRTPAHIKESNHPEGRDMISWLGFSTDWPLEVCEAFWFCLRNPTMHTGRTSIFTDHDRKSQSKLKLYADLIPNLDLDPMEYQEKHNRPTNETDGWMAVRDPMNPDHLEVSFFFMGLRRKLDAVRDKVYHGIEQASEDELAKLIRLNMKAFPFRFV